MQKRILNSIINNFDCYCPKWFHIDSIGPLRFDANVGSTPYLPVTRGKWFHDKYGLQQKTRQIQLATVRYVELDSAPVCKKNKIAAYWQHLALVGKGLGKKLLLVGNRLLICLWSLGHFFFEWPSPAIIPTEPRPSSPWTPQLVFNPKLNDTTRSNPGNREILLSTSEKNTATKSCLGLTCDMCNPWRPACSPSATSLQSPMSVVRQSQRHSSMQL